MFLGLSLFFLALIRASLGLYGGDSNVISLTPQNFDDKVKGSDEVWIVEYFAPWCGHCKSFAPEFSKAAKALKDVVRVGAVDCDAHKSLAGQYGIQGFPTVKIFGSNKNKPQDYQGPRTTAGLIDAAFKELRKVVDERIGKRTSDSKDVIELTDSNFKETVLQSNDLWLVEFYAPWCGHCKNLAPHWASAASKLKGKVKLGAVDATVHTALASKYGVQAFPTIKFFPAGSKTGEPGEYTGGRTADDIVNWALEKVADSAPPPKVKQITSNSDLTEACQDKQICVVSILPQLLDCQSQCRNEYLNVLQKISEKYRRNNWGWLWAEAIAQPSLEDSLGIGGFGYPAMAAVNARKMKYSILRGSFSFDGINEFMREVAVGRGASAPLKGAKLPDITPTEPWDGKDAEIPVEEDIDLSDVTLDDDVPKPHSTEL